jgi:two-component system chemotaxis response regulator CheB
MTAAAATTEPALSAAPKPIRVLIVDDSAIARGMTVRILEKEAGIEVAGTCGDGQMAVRQIARRDVDVIVLDIEMPVMDGLTALPFLLDATPGVRVLIASTLSQRNAQISLDALEKGASDYIPKPSTGRFGGTDAYANELVGKIRALGRRTRPLIATPRGSETRLRIAPGPAAIPKPREKIALRPPMEVSPHAIVIGSSTGGPKALMQVLGALPDTLTLPIFITQHMPKEFTAALADHLTKTCGRTCVEARSGKIVRDSHVYVAPGGQHMEVHRSTRGIIIRLTEEPPEHFCRPSVNPLFRSAAAAFGEHTLGIMLTGMGADGLEGAKMLTRAGGTVIAQDQATSVVWGMPGALASAGLCSAVLPLEEIAPEICRLAAPRHTRERAQVHSLPRPSFIPA